MKLPGRTGWSFLASLPVAVLLASCSGHAPEVVVYVSHDRVLSEPILQQFEAETGIRVRAVYDVEANKTVGLTNRLIAESASPRADVFWNNEVVQTIRLETRGITGSDPLALPADGRFRIADHRLRWVGFAGRARVLLLNTRLASVHPSPSGSHLGLWDLANPKWRGRCVVANPHFGTTGTHFAALLSVWGEPEFRRWLRALRMNDVAVMPGNAQVRESVASGRYLLGLTDTDDAVEAIVDGAPVRILFPDQDSGLGTLLIPNTVTRVTHAPHAPNGARLAAYLLSSQVEAALARGRGAQLPLNHAVQAPAHLPPLNSILVMEVDFDVVAANYERMLSIVEQEWPPDTASTGE